MNAPATQSQIRQAAPCGSAADAVHAWRGRCLDLFARGEALVVRQIVGRGKPIPHLTGQRLQLLAELFAQDGEGSAERGKALVAFRQHEKLRHYLSHGVTHVATSGDGEWLAILVMADAPSVSAEACMIVDEAAATAHLRALQSSKDKMRRAFSG